MFFKKKIDNNIDDNYTHLIYIERVENNKNNIHITKNINNAKRKTNTIAP